MKESFVLYRSTKDRVEFEREAKAIDDAIDNVDWVGWSDVRRRLPSRELMRLALQLGYRNLREMKDDPHVEIGMAQFDGVNCFVMYHSECEFIFLPRSVAEERWKKFADDVPHGHWLRATRFGKSGLDPRTESEMEV